MQGLRQEHGEQHDDLRPVILRRHSSSDVTKQKFGTMPLVPIRGDDTNTTMVSANQQLPMKMHQDSLEELQERQDEDHEPLYEEVGHFQSIQRPDSDCVFFNGTTPIAPSVGPHKEASTEPGAKVNPNETPIPREA
ncbi:unnamed protein product [Ranitomeya imitator]|uniref:Prolactin receptor n=1 Tax=Ranitomeya imitator TaxID=111125 RepID=A0ABN9LC65_9NEOB|nr:unnamed protein product [Ranitomeya imitator]